MPRPRRLHRNESACFFLCTQTYNAVRRRRLEFGVHLQLSHWKAQCFVVQGGMDHRGCAVGHSQKEGPFRCIRVLCVRWNERPSHRGRHCIQCSPDRVRSACKAFLDGGSRRSGTSLLRGRCHANDSLCGSPRRGTQNSQRDGCGRDGLHPRDAACHQRHVRQKVRSSAQGQVFQRGSPSSERYGIHDHRQRCKRIYRRTRDKLEKVLKASQTVRGGARSIPTCGMGHGTCRARLSAWACLSSFGRRDSMRDRTPLDSFYPAV